MRYYVSALSIISEASHSEPLEIFKKRVLATHGDVCNSLTGSILQDNFILLHISKWLNILTIWMMSRITKTFN